MDRPFDGPCHDLLVTVHIPCMLDEARDQQRGVHHATAHGRLLSSARNGVERRAT